jgi:signal transduction histidine kinase
VLEEIQVNTPPSLAIVFDYQGSCEEQVLDEKLMRHTITNLLSNAVKYSPEGGTVGLEVRCDEQQTTLRVHDHGIGIPEKDQKYIFEAFHRAQNVGAIKGTGLGLAITKNAVELHGGTIRFESQPGSGTTFSITIPASPSRGSV